MVNWFSDDLLSVDDVLITVEVSVSVVVFGGNEVEENEELSDGGKISEVVEGGMSISGGVVFIDEEELVVDSIDVLLLGEIGDDTSVNSLEVEDFVGV